MTQTKQKWYTFRVRVRFRVYISDPDKTEMVHFRTGDFIVAHVGDGKSIQISFFFFSLTSTLWSDHSEEI